MTNATSEMEPSRILFDGLQPFTLADRVVTGGFFSSLAGAPESAPELADTYGTGRSFCPL